MKKRTSVKNIIRVIDSNMVAVIDGECCHADDKLNDIIRNLNQLEFGIEQLISCRLPHVKYENIGQGYILLLCKHQCQYIKIVIHANKGMNIYEVIKRLDYAVIGSRDN